jgi:hypothetical protein
MSAHLLKNPRAEHTPEDDEESFVHVTTWLCVRYMPSSLLAHQIQDFLAKVFDLSFNDADKVIRGGDHKRLYLMSGVQGVVEADGLDIAGCHALSTLLSDLQVLFQQRYLYRPKQVVAASDTTEETQDGEDEQGGAGVDTYPNNSSDVADDVPDTSEVPASPDEDEDEDEPAPSVLPQLPPHEPVTPAKLLNCFNRALRDKRAWSTAASRDLLPTGDDSTVMLAGKRKEVKVKEIEKHIASSNLSAASSGSKRSHSMVEPVDDDALPEPPRPKKQAKQ